MLIPRPWYGPWYGCCCGGCGVTKQQAQSSKQLLIVDRREHEAGTSTVCRAPYKRTDAWEGEGGSMMMRKKEEEEESLQQQERRVLYVVYGTRIHT